MTPDPSDSPTRARLIVESEPSPESIRFLEERLYEFNFRATGIADGNLIGLFLQAPDGSPVGGVYGWTWGGTCYVRFSNRPFGVKHFQTIRRCSIDVAHGLVLLFGIGT
jgi:hypothetical protein